MIAPAAALDDHEDDHEVTMKMKMIMTCLMIIIMTPLTWESTVSDAGARTQTPDAWRGS